MDERVLKVAPASSDEAVAFGHLLPSLVRATGPVSYDYQFGADGRLFETLILASWRTPRTLFSATSTTLATVGDDLLWVEIGFGGPDFHAFKQNFAGLISDLVARGEVSAADARGLAERARKASYLNAHLPRSVYYLHALSVRPASRGHGVGARLLAGAIERARASGLRELQLDVLSDNPAVQFYRAMGLHTVVETVSPDLARDHDFPSELRMAIAL